MEIHYQLNDSDFESKFSDLSLDPTWFTHEAHIRLAWIHIKKYGVREAIDHITTQIKAFATHHGDSEKYNETVTVAAIRAVYHFILKSEADNFSDFMKKNMRLKTDFKKLLDSHYSLDIFRSEIAKKDFVDPDLEPFDELP